MKKGQKKLDMICISQKKAYLAGIVVSFVLTLISSFIISCIIANAGFMKENFNYLLLAIWLLPLLFAVFIIFNMSFLLILQLVSEKK